MSAQLNRWFSSCDHKWRRPKGNIFGVRLVVEIITALQLLFHCLLATSLNRMR